MAMKPSLFERLARASESAWKRADRRYNAHEKWANKAIKYNDLMRHDMLGPDGQDYLNEVIMPNYDKTSQMYDEASYLGESLEKAIQKNNAHFYGEGIDMLNKMRNRDLHYSPNEYTELEELIGNRDYSGIAKFLERMNK